MLSSRTAGSRAPILIQEGQMGVSLLILSLINQTSTKTRTQEWLIHLIFSQEQELLEVQVITISPILAGGIPATDLWIQISTFPRKIMLFLLKEKYIQSKS
jgi:hypothetical protein